MTNDQQVAQWRDTAATLFRKFTKRYKPHQVVTVADCASALECSEDDVMTLVCGHMDMCYSRFRMRPSVCYMP